MPYKFFLAILIQFATALFLVHVYNPIQLQSTSAKALESSGKTITIPPKNFVPKKCSINSQKGMTLFGDKKCALCHSIGGHGGCLGPLLDGVGARRSKEFLLARITDDDKQIKKFEKLSGGHLELMPHIRMAPKESSLIVEYLLTLPEPSGGYKVSVHEKQPDLTANLKQESLTRQAKNQSVQKGKELYQSLGCASCHTIGNVGGQFGPALDGVGLRHSSDYITNRITSGELQVIAISDNDHVVRFSMPPADLSDAEIEDITNFLLTLPKIN